MSAPNRTLITSVALDGACARLTASEIASAAGAIDTARVDLMMIGSAPSRLDALITAGWLGPRTTYAGLVVVLPTRQALPFHVARALSALDFLSSARAGWSPSTLDQTGAARPAETAPKALDFIEAALSLWNSWDVDALVIDKAKGLYLHAERVRRVNYRGPYFQVMGPLNAARPPQGYPVLVQSDLDPLRRLTVDLTDVLLVDSPNSQTLSMRHAEIVNGGGRARILASLRPGDQPIEATADQLATWFETSAIQGVHWTPSNPAELDWVVGGILPELRRRGLVQASPAASTLRGRLGGPAVAPTRAIPPVRIEA